MAGSLFGPGSGDLSGLFGARYRPGSAPGPRPTPTVSEANEWLARALEALRSNGDRDDVAALAAGLDGAVLTIADPGDGDLAAYLAVKPDQLRSVRNAVSQHFRPELELVARSRGWTLSEIQVMSLTPAERPAAGPPKRLELAGAIADSIATLKSYDVAGFCDRLGAPAHPHPNADPFSGKSSYVKARIDQLDHEALVRLGRQVLNELDDERLGALIDRCPTGGVRGEVKNIIFGSLRKPDLVLTDALSNEVGIVDPDACLFYAEPVPAEGLSWRHLVRSLLPPNTSSDERQSGLTLHKRLVKSLDSEPERLLFHVYARRYSQYGFDQPALIPQVWLHYDPRNARSRSGQPAIARQRMDFLLLLSGGAGSSSKSTASSTSARTGAPPQRPTQPWSKPTGNSASTATRSTGSGRRATQSSSGPSSPRPFFHELLRESRG